MQFRLALTGIHTQVFNIAMLHALIDAQHHQEHNLRQQLTLYDHYLSDPNKPKWVLTLIKYEEFNNPIISQIIGNS